MWGGKWGLLMSPKNVVSRNEVYVTRICHAIFARRIMKRTLNKTIARPINATDSVSLMREWLYNNRSELAAATIGMNLYGYSYDTMGNRLWSAANLATNTYVANALNQYTLVGRAAPSAPQTTFIYDADGNMTHDAAYIYSYDAENRLRAVTSRSMTNGALRVLNAYDHRNRRIRKTIQRLSDSVAQPPAPPVEVREWQTLETHTFVWDGNNIVFEKVDFADGTTRTFENFWGMDKSGTEQGAGGVGGLLAVSVDGVFYIPCYDHNGNIVLYVSETGGIAAQYTYEPYGNIIESSGPLADVFSFGFSTKYHDRETGVIGYQQRVYLPVLGRWLNRDPIEEEGGFNLYGFCYNNAIIGYDIDGGAVKTLEEIEASYREMIAVARRKGKNVAADNLEYFLSGRGGTRSLDWNWVRSFNSVITAEKRNKNRFEQKLKDKARELSNGECIIFNDYFDAMNTANVFSEMYYASGTFTISSYGEFTLHREGCVVSIDGNLDHQWHDDYDWHVGLSAYVPGFGNISDADGQRLEDAGRASSFKMISTWTQSLNATYTIRTLWWDTSTFRWGEPMAGSSGVFERYGRSALISTVSNSGGGGR